VKAREKVGVRREVFRIMQRANEQVGLIRLGDSDLVLEDQTQDARGLDVYDKDSDRIGAVEDLYADEKERKVRFLDVGVEDSLGMGEKRVLIPVEAVREVRDDGVVVDRTREEVAGSPPFGAEVVPSLPTDATSTTITAITSPETPRDFSGREDTDVEGSEGRRAPRWATAGLGAGAAVLFLAGLSVGLLLGEVPLGVLLFALGAVLFALRGYLEAGDKVVAGALIFVALMAIGTEAVVYFLGP
jgi:sporulation protein YlmC with PRC-barrel domain